MKTFLWWQQQSNVFLFSYRGLQVLWSELGCIESFAEQHAASVGVCCDGDVDDEDALVCYATLFWDGGGLHLEPHNSRSIQNPPSEDDPPAGLVFDVKHSSYHTRNRLLLKYREGGTLLQDARLWKCWQSYHVVIWRYARGKSEQLVLQDQRWASCGAAQRAGPKAGPLKVIRKDEICKCCKKKQKLLCIHGAKGLQLMKIIYTNLLLQCCYIALSDVSMECQTSTINISKSFKGVYREMHQIYVNCQFLLNGINIQGVPWPWIQIQCFTTELLNHQFFLEAHYSIMLGGKNQKK